jgi:hypothetical protein
MHQISITAALALTSALALSGCATPHVVQTRQSGDEALSCVQMKEQFAAARKYEEDARGDRGVTGKNVAAVVLFWPALIGTYMNTEDAIKAARERQTVLSDLSTKKNCGNLAS